jgi:hypothetical protein
MPRVHEYVDGKGLYIKARHEGRITTYQVTAQGEQFLRRHGIGDGDEISGRDLVYMLGRGLIYTGGSGPGVLDDDLEGATVSSRLHAPPRSNSSSSTSKDNMPWGCLILVGIVVFLLVVGQCSGNG